MTTMSNGAGRVRHRAASTARILCVDDEPQMLRLLVRFLGSWGYATGCAESVAQARERLAAEEYALVLCDVNMPGESGLDLLRDLSNDRPDLATVMVTGHDDPRLVDTAIELGAYGYVVKPFEPSELRISVSNALRRRSLELESLAYRELLELTVRQRTAALKQAVARLEQTQVQLRLTRLNRLVTGDRRLADAGDGRVCQGQPHCRSRRARLHRSPAA